MGTITTGDGVSIQFIDGVVDGLVLESAVDFSTATSQSALSSKLKSLYRYTGTGAPVTLTLSDTLKAKASTEHPWRFVIKDEGFDATDNNITITAESGFIDQTGNLSATIIQDSGAIDMYTNGTNYFTV